MRKQGGKGLKFKFYGKKLQKIIFKIKKSY